jgi:hypothetical protein
VSKLFNAAKKSGNWTDYKRSLTDYNKALRQAKSESWRRHCEEIEKAPDSIWFSPRKGGVQLAPFNLIMESILREIGKPSRNYFEFTFLALRLFWKLLEVGTVLNWNFRNGK